MTPELESGHETRRDDESSRRPKNARAKAFGRGVGDYIDNISDGAGDAPKAAKFAIVKTWETKGAWPFGWACFVCGLPIVCGVCLNFIVGGISGFASKPTPLPLNAPGEMRFSQGLTSFGKSVFTGFSNGINQGVQVQFVGNQTQPNNNLTPVRTNSNGGFLPVIPVYNHNGTGYNLNGYQSR